jgi:hypothetical protein
MTQPDPADAEDYLAADPEQLAHDTADYYNDVCTPPLAFFFFPGLWSELLELRRKACLANHRGSADHSENSPLWVSE